MDNEKMDRRGFLKASSVLGVGSVIGASALLAACSEENKMVPLKQPGEFYVPELPDKAIDGKELKVGIVGCGGRGCGCVQQLMEAANGIKIHAIGDVFPDRMQNLRNMAKAQYNIEIPDENCFLGFDAVQPVQGGHIRVQIVNKIIIYGLFPLGGQGDFLDHLTGSIPQGRRAVEYRGHKGFVRIIQKQLGSL